MLCAEHCGDYSFKSLGQLRQMVYIVTNILPFILRNTLQIYGSSAQTVCPNAKYKQVKNIRLSYISYIYLVHFIAIKCNIIIYLYFALQIMQSVRTIHAALSLYSAQSIRNTVDIILVDGIFYFTIIQIGKREILRQRKNLVKSNKA